VIKTERYYDLNFANSQVDRIEPNALQHDYYGGEKVNTECDKDLSSERVIGIVVGWKKDLLLAYGIIRDVNNRPVELNRLFWHPHSGPFTTIKLDGPNEFDVRNPNYAVRICWAYNGDAKWHFNSNYREDEPRACTSSYAPFSDADQTMLPIPAP
jgi:hypothetical protein